MRPAGMLRPPGQGRPRDPAHALRARNTVWHRLLQRVVRPVPAARSASLASGHCARHPHRATAFHPGAGGDPQPAGGTAASTGMGRLTRLETPGMGWPWRTARLAGEGHGVRPVPPDRPSTHRNFVTEGRAWRGRGTCSERKRERSWRGIAPERWSSARATRVSRHPHRGAQRQWRPGREVFLDVPTLAQRADRRATAQIRQLCVDFGRDRSRGGANPNQADRSLAMGGTPHERQGRKLRSGIYASRVAAASPCTAPTDWAATRC